jgi:hypothetical protein
MCESSIAFQASLTAPQLKNKCHSSSSCNIHARTISLILIKEEIIFFIPILLAYDVTDYITGPVTTRKYAYNDNHFEAL